MSSRRPARQRRCSTPTAPVALTDGLLALADQAFACHRAGRFAEAVTLYERILLLRPDLSVIHNNLGLALAGLGRFEEAVMAYQRSIALKPDDRETLCNWGAALADLDRCDEAAAKFRRVIALNPGFAPAYNNLGVILKEKGRSAEARRAAEQAIRLVPGDASYYENLGAVRSFVAGDPYVTALETMAKDAAALSPAQQTHLHFALAKAHEDTGRSESAFQHLLIGNALKRRQIAYDEAATLAGMDRTRAVFSPEFMKSRQGSGQPSPVPVFIVGMPRSGTTLVEQILASHPAIFGAGELLLFEQVVNAMRNALPRCPPFPEMASAMSDKNFRTLGAHYLEKLMRRAPGATRITDKMPANFRFAGLIHLALPDATIIHVVRDAVDTCVSCFSLNFYRGQQQTYDLAELGRYYRHYRALMTHWQRVLPPGRMIEVRYGELVGDLEGVARRIIAHCGLAWDARCLDFHRTERTVRTASATQVRQPIYKSSVGRWRKYEKFLGPLLAELEPANALSCTEQMHG